MTAREPDQQTEVLQTEYADCQDAIKDLDKKIWLSAGIIALATIGVIALSILLY